MQDKKDINRETQQIEITEFKIGGKVFIEKDCLKKLAEHIHGKDNVFMVAGAPYFTGPTHRRLDWINEQLLVKVFKGYSGLESVSHPLYFTYVKFAKSKDKKDDDDVLLFSKLNDAPFFTLNDANVA